jgi:hypothetical protein
MDGKKQNQNDNFEKRELSNTEIQNHFETKPMK